MPQHTEAERKKRREKRDPGRPVAFVGNVPVPAREKPELAARQAEERRQEDIKIKQEESSALIPEQIGTVGLREQVEPLVKPGQAPSFEAEGGVAKTFIREQQEETLRIQGEQREFFGKLFSGKASRGEIFKEGKKFATGVAITGGAIFAAVGGIAAGTALLTTAGRVGISGNVAKLGAELVALGGVVLGFGAVRDLNRDEINNMKKIAQRMVEGGERIEAFDRQAGTPEFAIEQLQIMIDDLNFAESVIQQKSKINFKYQGSSEFVDDMTLFRNSRNAILRRITAVENIAISGRAQLDPIVLAQEVASIT